MNPGTPNLGPKSRATIVFVNTTGPRWPTKRPDGSLSVGPRWTAQPEELDKIRGLLPELIAQYDTSSFYACFLGPPEYLRDGDTLAVALHARPGALPWKDWVVRIVVDVQQAFPGLARPDFFDFVANKVRGHDWPRPLS